MKLNPCFLPHTKWIKNLNVRPETIKLLGENIGENFHDTGKGFVLMVPAAQTTQAKLELKLAHLFGQTAFLQRL